MCYTVKITYWKMAADGFKPQGYTARKHLPGSAGDVYKG
jgi:hypothetical protein